MKNMKYIQYLSACLLFPILFGCQREEPETLDGIGTPVRFSVATNYAPETRTVFSDVLYGESPSVERIDWVDGDVFRVNNGGTATADYAVASHTASNESSIANVTSSAPLTWQSANGYFYGLYPSPATTGVTASLSTNTATGTIPSDQTSAGTLSGREFKAGLNKFGYMCTAASGTVGANVNLVFKPLMTAFRFELYANALSVPTAKLTSVTLSSTSTSLAGNFSATIATDNTYTASVTGGASSSVTVSLGTGFLLNTTEPVIVTLLALPVAQTNLTLSLGFDDGKTRSIPLKQGSTFVTVPAGQKMYVNNMGVPGESGWKFKIEDIPNLEVIGHEAVSSSPDLEFTVTSYKYDVLNPSQKQAVPWKVKYSADGVDWRDTPAAAGIGSKFALTTTSGVGSTTTGEASSAQILANHSMATDYENGYTNDLAAARMAATTIPAELLDSDGYYDLSKHAIYGSSYYGPETTQETANCYVISRPGKYKFPAVYGNAIREGATNDKAYMPQGFHMVEGTGNQAVDHLNVNNVPQFMRRFQKHDNYWITYPDIRTQIGGGWNDSEMRVIWQTGAADIIDENDISIVKTAGSTDNYIYFEVKSENIRPGNVLIGLWYNPSSGDKFYVWSWHIWVTDEDLTPVAGNNYSMLKNNLGWINSATAQTEKWSDWTFYVKVYQDVSGGAEKIFTVTQKGDVIGGATQEKGNSLLYQWGRKDPFPIDWGTSNYTTKHGLLIGWADVPTIPNNESGVQPTTNWNSSMDPATTNPAFKGMRVGHGIKNPYTLYKNSTTHHWLTGDDACALIGNLWDADFISGSSSESQEPIKSVYDPSPRGFVVAKSPILTSFSTASPSVVVTGEGWNFATGSGSNTVFFPFTYGLKEDGTNYSDAYHWSLTSDSYKDADNKYKAKALKVTTGTTVGVSHQYKDQVMPVRSVVQTRFQ